MKKLVLILLATQLGACASVFKTREKNTDAVTKIQKAAVVAFTHETPAATEIGLNLGSGKLEGDRGGSAFNQESPESVEILEKTISAFRNKLQWHVMDSKTMLAMPQYTAAYKSTMEGWQSKMAPNPGMNRYLVPKVMDYDCARILDVAGREKLMDDLHVDALVAVTSRVVLNKASILPFSGLKPQTRITFFVYTRGNEKPVWFETLEGNEMDSVGRTGFFDEKKLAKFSLPSADSALEKLGKENKD